MSRLFIVTLLLGVFTIANGQNRSRLLDATAIEEDRYSGVKGDPYAFDENMKATLIDVRGNESKDIEVNFNAHEGDFEVYRDETFLVLNARQYPTIKITKSDNEDRWEKEFGDTLTFRSGIYKEKRDKYVLAIYEGEKLTLIKDYDMAMIEKEINNVGSIVKIKRFKMKEKNYLIHSEKMERTKLKKKDFLKLFNKSDKKAIEKHLKDTDNKLKTFDDFAILMKHVEANW